MEPYEITFPSVHVCVYPRTNFCHEVYEITLLSVCPPCPVQILAAVCQSLVLNYGMSHTQTLGPSYDSFLTTVSSCLLTASVLLVCYLLSDRSMGLLRASLFVSNRFACHSLRFLCAARLRAH
jgi:hypothetical protein